MARPDKVCLGIVVGAHGIRGAVRIKSFTANPGDVAAYGEVGDDAGGRRFAIKILGTTRGAVLATMSGIDDRNAAEALRGLRLYVARAALPPTGKNEYYHADLIGLTVERKDATPLGRVFAVLNFGAGDILEIRDASGAELLLPFQQQYAPVIDIEGGRIVVDPPAELEPAASPGDPPKAADRRRARRGPKPAEPRR